MRPRVILMRAKRAEDVILMRAKRAEDLLFRRLGSRSVRRDQKSSRSPALNAQLCDTSLERLKPVASLKLNFPK